MICNVFGSYLELRSRAVSQPAIIFSARQLNSSCKMHHDIPSKDEESVLEILLPGEHEVGISRMSVVRSTVVRMGTRDSSTYS